MDAEDTRQMSVRKTQILGDDTVEIETRKIGVSNAENGDSVVSASCIDTLSRGDTVELVPEPPDTAALPEPARRAAHRLERFAMNGPKRELVVAGRLPIDENPVSAYLAGLAESSRRPMRTDLETVAWFVSGGRASALELAWWKLRYQHTALIRSTLAEAYAPATANLMLSAVRGVLKACFRLGYMGADDRRELLTSPPLEADDT